MSDEPARRPAWSRQALVAAPWLFALVGFAFSLKRFLDLALDRDFRVDEFQYAHAAWEVSQGRVPFRDFFDHHLAFPYQLIAPALWIQPEELNAIQTLRLTSVVWVTLLSATGAYLVRRWGIMAMLLAVVGLTSFAPLITRTVEVRPDLAGATLYVCVLGTLSSNASSRVRGILGGFLTGTALLCTLKVWVYGLPLAVAVGADWLRAWKRQPAATVGHVGLFTLATLLPVAVYVGWLLSVGAWSQFYRWCFTWALAHEGQAQAFSPWPLIKKPLEDLWPVLPCAAWGLYELGASWWKDRKNSLHLVVLGSLLSTLGSVLKQAYPYDYSLIPFWSLLILTSALGLGGLLQRLGSELSQSTTVWFRHLASYGPLLGTVVVALLLPEQLSPSRYLPNERQLILEREREALIDEDQVVYDNMAQLVTRRHAYYFYYTSVSVRRTEAKRFETEIPQAIEESQSTVWINDTRTWQLPTSVKTYLSEHFIPVGLDLCLWGRAFEGQTRARFFANKTGRYYLWSETPDLEVRVNGKVLGKNRELELKRGTHEISVDDPKSPFWLIWLPATGQHLKPVNLGRPRGMYI